MKRLLRCVVPLFLFLTVAFPVSVEAIEKRSLTLDDLGAFREVREPRVSPDGAWVVYSVGMNDFKEDKQTGDLWMARWDGSQTLRLTTTKESEHHPDWSPDGQYLSFLSGREVGGEMDQLWLMNRLGGEAERITEFKGAVTDYAWSPDSRRLVLVVEDPDPDSVDGKEKAEKKTPKPIVINRFQFKEDGIGYLRERRQHLYLFELSSRKAEILTPGSYDEYFPVWSPSGSAIAFVSKRGEDFDRHENYDLYIIEPRAGAVARQLTTFTGPDCHPDWESYPAWSPDGLHIAYLQGGPKDLIDYAIHQLAVIPASGGPAKLLTASLDRNVTKPRWSKDSSFIYFLLEDDRNSHLARIPSAGGTVEWVLAGRRNISSFDLGPGGKLVILESQPDIPSEVYAVEATGTRPISRQNGELISQLRLGAVQEITFHSKDGTDIGGLVVRPPDFKKGRKYPALLRIHGGPVGQFSNEFDFEWQLFATKGYVVVAANPRGSSGRGLAFSTAIYADWGNKDAQDVLAAVDFVVAEGIADPNRLGIGGWSYGGMLTNYTIAQDQRFRAAVSGASASNILADYGTDMYVRDYEIELGTPWTHLDNWLRVSFPFLHADRIVTPTLFLCGDKDFNVPLLNSEQMYQALRSLGRDTQLVIYPGQTHDITQPSFQRDRLERNLKWYDKYLQ